MSDNMELLTAKDVEIKVFKKVRFGGYAIAEVEDFLNQVADDLEVYAEQIEEKDARIRELEEYVQKQQSMSDMIKDALIQARKAANDMEAQAKNRTEKILSDANLEASKLITGADEKVQSRIDDAEKKAAEILARAKNTADDIIKESKEKTLKTEQVRANIENELQDKRNEAKLQADDMIAQARVEARRIVNEAAKDVEEYENQIKFLYMRKQQFLKDTVSLLLDFGRTIDKAQQEADAEAEPHESSQYYAQDNHEERDLSRMLDEHENLEQANEILNANLSQEG